MKIWFAQDSLFLMSQTHSFSFCLSCKFNFYFHFSRKFHLRFFFHPLLKVIFLQLCYTALLTSAALIELWKYFEGLPFPHSLESVGEFCRFLKVFTLPDLSSEKLKSSNCCSKSWWNLASICRAVIRME